MGICQNTNRYQETERLRKNKRAMSLHKKQDGGVSNPQSQLKNDVRVEKKPQFLSGSSNDAFPDEANISPVHHHKEPHHEKQPHRIHHHAEPHKGHHNGHGGHHFIHHESAGHDHGSHDCGGGD